MASLLCLDFDDTIVLDNMSRAVLGEFADPRWRDLEAAYHRGEMSVEQYNAAAFELIPNGVTREQLTAFAVAQAHPRDGIQELVDWALWNDWQAVVVSNGYDFYVEGVLDSLGLDRVARHAGRTRFDYRWGVRYYSPRGIEIADGFKVAYGAAFRDGGDFVAYVGDGASDVAAARLAPVVFARSTLWERLHDEHPRIFPFETFHDIIAVLDREARGWLAAIPTDAAGR